MGLERKQFTELLPNLLRHPSILFKDARVLADAIPLFGFLAPSVQLVTGPVLMNLEYKRSKRPEDERKLLVMQEFVSQCVALSAHIVSFASGGIIARKLLPPINPGLFVRGSTALKDGETLACLVGGFVGGTFLRPVLSAFVVNRFSPNTPNKKANIQPSASTAPYFQRQQLTQPVQQLGSGYSGGLYRAGLTI